MPDWLLAAARDVAGRKEISLAELVRRGLEYMVAVSPPSLANEDEWSLPESYALGSRDVFAEPNWRQELHTERLQAAEARDLYGSGSES